MTSSQLCQPFGNDNIVALPVAENAIEIAMNSLEFLQDHLDMGRDAIIRQYILPWAHEAEATWRTLKENNAPANFDVSYYDFIDDFSARKQAQFLQVQLP